MSSQDVARKVRPIYDALDARNNKQALKLCNAALAKSSVPIIASLKSIALEGLGKPDEALAVAREVAAASPPPCDEQVLSTLMLAFKGLGCAAEGTAAYEAAFNREPSASLGELLFSSYLRTAEFGKAQALALKRYKQPGGDEQLYWAVACMLLQADMMAPPRQPTPAYADAPAAPAAAKLLQLAAAMCARAAGQGKLTSEAHVLLYHEALRRQGAADAACKLLDEHG